MKRSKFVNKIVNLVDKALCTPLNDYITIYWNYDNMTISLYHDTYGFAGTYTLENLYKRFSNLSTKIKVKECDFCIEYAKDVTSDVKMFVREKTNPIIFKSPFEGNCYKNECQCSIDKDEPFEDDEFDEEEFFKCEEECENIEEPFSEEDEFDDVIFDVDNGPSCEECDCGNRCGMCRETCRELREARENPFECNEEKLCKESKEDELPFPDVEKMDLNKIEKLVKPQRATCPSCGSNDSRKNGSKRGKQQWVCKSCGRYFSE